MKLFTYREFKENLKIAFVGSWLLLFIVINILWIFGLTGSITVEHILLTFWLMSVTSLAIVYGMDLGIKLVIKYHERKKGKK